MNSRILQAIGWTAFAALLIMIGVVFLSACDLGFTPIFGLRYCQAKAAPTDLTSERERERSLRTRIHEAELKVAQLPPCAEKAAELPPPPAPKPAPPAPPAPPTPEPLKIPKQLSELEGCWQSERGDMNIVTDDEARRNIGRVRICYCFDANGHGKARWLWNDSGQICEGKLGAEIGQQKLTLRHDKIPCVRAGISSLVPETIVCAADAEGSGTCDAQAISRTGLGFHGEKFHHVSNEYCNWDPPR
ncbi:MAG TPA: hypothetical protein VH206_20065 [Xanthobacteraceae bacterium]|nr:hypothetical protein [Xanthobacteraceae bacterium]